MANSAETIAIVGGLGVLGLIAFEHFKKGSSVASSPATLSPLVPFPPVPSVAPLGSCYAQDGNLWQQNPDGSWKGPNGESLPAGSNPCIGAGLSLQGQCSLGFTWSPAPAPGTVQPITVPPNTYYLPNGGGTCTPHA